MSTRRAPFSPIAKSTPAWSPPAAAAWCCADAAQAVDVDVVLERQSGQHFDAQVVGDEVLTGDGRLDVIVDVDLEGAAGQPAVVRLRRHLVDAGRDGPVALGLGHGWGGGERQGGGQAGHDQGGALAHGGVLVAGWMGPYDSVPGRFKADVAVQGNDLLVNGKKIRLTQERDPANLKWDEVGADVVLEATGLS
uniref:Glyceraldehyde 3-phosphate dehydrogenase NAD(P) binding domain-containing protein n=1 Tax=Panagrolaimus superbus TaxID=310955 RepID=A0A914Z8X9_9BILA